MSQFCKHSKTNTAIKSKHRRVDIPACDYITREREEVPQSERQDTSDANCAPFQRSKFPWFPPPAEVLTTGQEDSTRQPDDVTAAVVMHQRLGFLHFSPSVVTATCDVNSAAIKCATCDKIRQPNDVITTAAE